ncbi:hypothetical protein ES689_02055 [Frigoribacterium sp. ACAM 257]|uniref:hypothetical protein n=1 Tax=Frigoribacterium sp. ACAM 257 TaxID=2508998 RepID=UPI0011B9617D|nr:hypothetical protein [Frigoribacterium sp. ACAM 257]TWX40273.1 hypothetical protein ES689_02055 [Frigoribacterium sp. ACAM 257]
MKRASIITWSIVGGVVVVGGIVAAVAVAASDGGPDAPPSVSPTTSATPTASSTPAATPSASAEPGTDPSEPDSGPSAEPTPAVPVGPGQQTTEVPAAPAPGTTPVSVTPFVTFDQWTAESSTLTVGATVPEVVEQGGVCTLTATRGAATVSGSFTALPSASSTDCGSMALSSPSFSAGTWTVSVAYASPTAAGTLSDYEVTIP